MRKNKERQEPTEGERKERLLRFLGRSKEKEREREKKKENKQINKKKRREKCLFDMCRINVRIVKIFVFFLLFHSL